MTNTTSLDDSKPKISFVKDIQLMLYGLGDCSRPLESTAALMETIVIDQIKILMSQAEEIAEMRGEEIVGPEDILFRMRRNETFLKRLVTYLGLQDEKLAFCKGLVDLGIQDTVNLNDETVSVKWTSKMDQLNAPAKWRKNRKAYCLEFLKSIGIEESDLHSIDDSIKESRLIRANNRAMDLTAEAYEKFHKARCASFSSAHITSQRFIDWLQSGGVEQTLTAPVLEMLIYIAKEIIATLVDMALILREEDPMGQFDSAITPLEIQEVLRRCNYQQTLIFAGFSRDLPLTATSKLII